MITGINLVAKASIWLDANHPGLTFRIEDIGVVQDASGNQSIDEDNWRILAAIPTQAELDAVTDAGALNHKLKNEALAELAATDIDTPRSIEDLYGVVFLLGGQMPIYLSNKIAAKKAARSAYLALS